MAGSRQWLHVFLANVFFACVSFSIAIPTLYNYLAQLGGNPLGSRPLFYALTVSIYSVGEVIGSILFGWGYGKAPGPKTAVIATLSVGLVGSVLFAGAGIYAVGGHGESAAWIAFIGRLVQGLWTGGQQTVEQAYLSEYVVAHQLTTVTASLGSAAVLGFILGPTFATALAFLDFGIGEYQVNANTSPGLFMLVIAVVMIIMTALLFQSGDGGIGPSERLGTEKEPLLGKRGAANVYEDELAGERSEGIHSSTHDSGAADRGTTPAPPSTIGLALCLVAFFVHFYSFAVYETIMTPLVPELYGWSAKSVDVLFVCAGIVSLLSSLAVKFLAGRVSDVQLLLASVLIGALGNMCMIDFPGYAQGSAGPPPLGGFITGFVLLNIAFPIGRNVVLSLYSKIIGPCPQGRYMGAIIALGAVPRAVGPFWAVYALCIPQEGSEDSQKYPDTLCHTDPGMKPETYVLFGTTALAFCAMLVVVTVAARRGLLAPHPDVEREAKAAGKPEENAINDDSIEDSDIDIKLLGISEPRQIVGRRSSILMPAHSLGAVHTPCRGSLHSLG